MQNDKKTMKENLFKTYHFIYSARKKLSLVSRDEYQKILREAQTPYEAEWMYFDLPDPDDDRFLKVIIGIAGDYTHGEWKKILTEVIEQFPDPSEFVLTDPK